MSDFYKISNKPITTVVCSFVRNKLICLLPFIVLGCATLTTIDKKISIDFHSASYIDTIVVNGKYTVTTPGYLLLPRKKYYYTDITNEPCYVPQYHRLKSNVHYGSWIGGNILNLSLIFGMAIDRMNGSIFYLKNTSFYVNLKLKEEAYNDPFCTSAVQRYHAIQEERARQPKVTPLRRIEK